MRPLRESWEHCSLLYIQEHEAFHRGQAEPIGVRSICLTVNDLHVAGPRDIDREMPNKRFFP